MRLPYKKLKAFPAALALSDYIGGLTLSDNPYPKKSLQYDEYEKAMHRHLSDELKSSYRSDLCQ